MAAPETQNPNAGNAPVLIADALLAKRAGITVHDWISYAMAIGTVGTIIGASLLLLSNFWPYAMMVLIGAVCLAIASVVWVGIFGFLTWKIGGIVFPLLCLRLRR